MATNSQQRREDAIERYLDTVLDLTSTSMRDYPPRRLCPMTVATVGGERREVKYLRVDVESLTDDDHGTGFDFGGLGEYVPDRVTVYAENTIIAVGSSDNVAELRHKIRSALGW